jgi:hypothetical protein
MLFSFYAVKSARNSDAGATPEMCRKSRTLAHLYELRGARGDRARLSVKEVAML